MLLFARTQFPLSRSNFFVRHFRRLETSVLFRYVTTIYDVLSSNAARTSRRRIDICFVFVCFVLFFLRSNSLIVESRLYEYHIRSHYVLYPFFFLLMFIPANYSFLFSDFADEVS